MQTFFFFLIRLVSQTVNEQATGAKKKLRGESAIFEKIIYQTLYTKLLEQMWALLTTVNVW